MSERRVRDVLVGRAYPHPEASGSINPSDESPSSQDRVGNPSRQFVTVMLTAGLKALPPELNASDNKT
jgi:hypothetical protein